MNRSCLRLSIVCAVASLCWPALGEPGVTADAITFGQVAPFEGPAASIGRGVRTGLLAAFEEANRAGGVKGRKLALISEDDGYDPAKSIEATKNMVSSGKVFALIGSVGTPTSAVIEPIATDARLPFLAPFTGAPFLREPFNPNVVNLNASYAQETETMVERLTADRGISRIAILHQDDAMGRAVLMGIYKALAKRGLASVAEGVFERNTIAVKAALLKIQRTAPEAIILAGMYKPCAEFIRLARELKLNALILVGSYAGGNALLSELGPAGAGVIVTQVVPLPEDETLPVAARYRAALNSAAPSVKPGVVTFQAYIAARFAIAVLEKEQGEPVRANFLDTIFSSSFDLGGITYTFGPGSNQGTNDVFITVIQPDGSYKAVHNLRLSGNSW